jgi:ornithine carbamoyltransferase
MAMHQLGGHSIYLSPEEVGLGKREPVADVARVLSRYVDGITARTFSHETLRILAEFACAGDQCPIRPGTPLPGSGRPAHHPREEGKLPGLTWTYVGDGNNVANSLLLSSCLVGIHFRLRHSRRATTSLKRY